MTPSIKPDADKIVAHIQSLKKQPWLEKRQQWWPDYLFHFTDITNAVNILKSEAILSRNALERAGRDFCDGASQSVIDRTDLEKKDNVRLYFRPRTPTLHANEGFRPVGAPDKPHCPVPIFFLFDSRAILERAETEFSDGNIAKKHQVKIGETYSFFKQIPFEKVYHDRFFSAEERDDIVFHRHAEVLVPEKLGLEYLKFIRRRSEAEYETLRDLLPEKVLAKWGNRISAVNKDAIFFSKWTHVLKAEISKKAIKVYFNPDSQTPSPFSVEIQICELESGKTYSWNAKGLRLNEDLSFNFTQELDDYQVQLYIDEHIAYSNSCISETEEPF
ncbi:MAG: DUF4433 domain-containing protein [Elusimicrobia bacterium]|nr:DUF4433 domain-containing protein [Elusimicrobiota bacterium]